MTNIKLKEHLQVHEEIKDKFEEEGSDSTNVVKRKLRKDKVEDSSDNRN